MKDGDRLAHFEIRGRLGAGGMGVVHRARDTRLDREVAVKVLPPEFTDDPERLARFQREAKVLASLNHPNIAAIYGLEQADGRNCLVMELVEGEDLSERIRRGALPVEEAIGLAVQIAEGLEEAHERGIVHRDLKPANIKLTPDGKVKILDFGLARAFAGESAKEGDLSRSPTITAMTQPGVILGTAAYMSPEQARGKPVDRRADIWAFGLILFEMLTGRQVFSGETVSDTIAGILVKDPDWASLPGDLPPRVERVLRRCLERDPRQRLRDIGEARIRLSDPRGMSEDAPPEAPPAPKRSRRLSAFPWAVAALCIAAAAFFFVRGGGGRSGADLLHLAYPVPPGTEFKLNSASPAAPVISPDGSRVVFGAVDSEGGGNRLYVRSLSAGKAYALDGTENAQYPFWSPDGRWIGFFVMDKGLKKVPLNGGPVQTLCDAANGKGGTWNKEGVILFAPSFDQPISRVAAAGGEATPVTKLEGDTNVDSHRHPRFLPDGKHFLYLARNAGSGESSTIRLASLDGGPEHDLIHVPSAAEFANGRLLFVRDQVLMAQELDVDAGALKGEAIPVAENVLTLSPDVALATFSVSANGALTYLVSQGEITATLQWRDRRGNISGQLGDEAIYESVSLSPDASMAAAVLRESPADDQDIWVYEIDRNLRTRFTFDDADENFPIWQPDGRAILFASNRNEEFGVYRKEVGGGGEVTKLIPTPKAAIPNSISPDGHFLLYTIAGDSTGWDLWVADLTGAEEPRVLRQTSFLDGVGMFSPDGKWITFFSSESGDLEIYLAPFPAMAPIRQVSTTTGGWNAWRGDGREIYYQEDSGRVMAAPVSFSGNDVKIGAPEPLFEHRTPSGSGILVSYAPDGEHFLTIESDLKNAPEVGEIVLGWPRLLKQP